jgi:hypothetical protein
MLITFLHLGTNMASWAMNMQNIKTFFMCVPICSIQIFKYATSFICFTGAYERAGMVVLGLNYLNYCCQKFGFRLSTSVWNARSHTFYVPFIAISEQRQPNRFWLSTSVWNARFHTFYVQIIAISERRQPNTGFRNSLKNKYIL